MKTDLRTRFEKFISIVCLAALCACDARKFDEDPALTENLVASDAERKKITFTEIWAFQTAEEDKGIDLTMDVGLRAKEGRIFESSAPEEISELRRILSSDTTEWPKGTDNRAPGVTIHIFLKERETNRLAYVRVLMPYDSKIEPTFRLRDINTVFYSPGLGKWIRQRIKLPSAPSSK
jgi:hypothetical protein